MTNKLTKKQVFQIIGVCALVALMLAVVILGVVYGIQSIPETLQETQSQESSSLMIESSAENGIALASSEATVASDGTTTQLLTASITPASATKKALSWSIAFKNENSTWATGKTVTDYVTISPISDNDIYCKVTCAQAFGEQIIIKCQSVDYPDIYATATVDYVRKVTGVSLSIQCDDSSYETNYHGIRRMRVLDDPDTYTFVPTVLLEDTYTIDKSYEADLKWQISTDSSKGLLGQARNPIHLTMNGKYNLSMVDNPSVHTEKTVKLSLDFLCGEIFADRFTNTSRYISDDQVPAAQNCMRSAVIEGLNYCSQQAPGYLFTATVSYGDYSQAYSIALGTLDVSVPLETVSIDNSAIQF